MNGKNLIKSRRPPQLDGLRQAWYPSLWDGRWQHLVHKIFVKFCFSPPGWPNGRGSPDFSRLNQHGPPREPGPAGALSGRRETLAPGGPFRNKTTGAGRLFQASRPHWVHSPGPERAGTALLVTAPRCGGRS